MRFLILFFSDKLLAILFIVLLSPFVLLLLLIVYLSDLNSPFFLQKRVGKNLSVFTLYKIRSMKPQRSLSYPYETTSNDDPRITNIGLFIRKYSLDELPQLVNILQGHMSFVGPRPVTHNEENNFSMEHWCFRHSVRPGLTGLAQIYKPRKIEDQEELEKMTIKKIDVIFYFSVLLRTLKVFYKNK